MFRAMECEWMANIKIIYNTYIYDKSSPTCSISIADDHNHILLSDTKRHLYLLSQTAQVKYTVWRTFTVLLSAHLAPHLLDDIYANWRRQLFLWERQQHIQLISIRTIIPKLHLRKACLCKRKIENKQTQRKNIEYKFVTYSYSVWVVGICHKQLNFA